MSLFVRQSIKAVQRREHKTDPTNFMPQNVFRTTKPILSQKQKPSTFGVYLTSRFCGLYYVYVTANHIHLLRKQLRITKKRHDRLSRRTRPQTRPRTTCYILEYWEYEHESIRFESYAMMSCGARRSIFVRRTRWLW